jgi:hypothetical protein
MKQTPPIVLFISGAIIAETVGAAVDGPICNPHRELCQIEHAALPDEASEHLPRGPAPKMQTITIASSTSAISGIETVFVPYRT